MIDGEFNFCRDSMTAAITILKAIKKKGVRVFNQVPSYNIARVKVAIDRKEATNLIKKLRKEYPESDELDGIKIKPTARSWVLIRPSGTEDAVRISAEARTAREAQELMESFTVEVRRLVS